MRNTITICLPPDVRFNLDRYCKEISSSRSSFIAQAICQYMDVMPKGLAPPPPKRKPNNLPDKLMEKLKEYGGRARQWDLFRPYAGTSTAEEREAVMAMFERCGVIRRTKVQPLIGPPVVHVEMVPDGVAAEDMPQTLAPAASAEADMDRVLSYVARRGGRVQWSRLTATFQRYGTARLRAAVEGMVARGLLARVTEPKGARPGRPRTWITLAPNPAIAVKPNATPEELIRKALEKCGGRASVPMVRDMVRGHLSTRDADEQMVRLHACGDALMDRDEAQEAWITLLPAKAPVSPVAASVEQEASTMASAAGIAYAPDSASVDTVAAPAAEVAP